MIESALYILLGFIIAVLMMLIIIPMIWRRAVRLTEKKVLGEIPISYSELQAEKDMQRAEQAITQRRLEVSVESQREQLTLNSIKIDRLQQTIATNEDTIANHLQTIAQKNEQLSNKQDQYTHQTGQLEQSRSSLAQAKEQISDLEEVKADRETQILHLETEKSEQKVELVAQLARLEALRGENSELTQSLKSETDAKNSAESKLGQKSTDFDRNKIRLEQLDEKFTALQTEVADKDAEIATLTNRLKRLQNSSNTSTTSEAEARLAETEARRVEAEAKISSLTLELADQNEPSQISKVKDEGNQMLEQENQHLKSKVTDLEASLKELTAKMEASPLHEDSPLSPAEHKLREEMKNIAAQVTLAAMENEEKPSKIEEILQEDNLTSQKEDPLSKVLSLAGHIANLTKGNDKKDGTKG